MTFLDALTSLGTVLGGGVAGWAGARAGKPKAAEEPVTRGTIAPAAPTELQSLTGLIADIGRRVAALEAANAKRDQVEAAERVELVREELKVAVREMTSALRGAKERKSDDKPPTT